MTIQPIGSVMIDLQPQLQWLWYSQASGAVITGDENDAFKVSVANPITVSRLDRGKTTKSAFNLPLPDALADELLQEPWHGLRFLQRASYAGFDADILRTFVFGPNYNVPMLHPPSEAMIGFRSNAMELFTREAGALKPIDKTKPRGKAALCFAAHPSEALLVYGDNHGTFTAHRFDAGAFGKASKIADKERKASAAEFIDNGTKLLIGGMGYLATFAYDGKKFSPLHELSTSVRDFIVGSDGQTIVVNHGLHGVSIYRYDATGFSKQAEVKPPEPVQFAIVSRDFKHLAVTHQNLPKVTVYAFS
jgi:hypothetical protein